MHWALFSGTGGPGLLGVESFVKDSTVAFLASFFLFLLPSGRKDDEGKYKTS